MMMPDGSGMDECDFVRIPGHEHLVAPLELGPPVHAVTEWNGRLFIAQSGCIWFWRPDLKAWELADGADMPPSFPPARREAQHVDEG